jgi:two-component system CheB/CheR fusion protein
VNAELQGKIDELSGTNDDMRNLLDATKIATIFLDQRLCIKRFTAETAKIINLIPTDVGRPVSHIMTNLEQADIEGAARRVLDSLMPQEKEVRSRDGRWYQLRILPYRTVDNVIDGVVVTLADITELKHNEALAQQARIYAESIVDTVREAILVLDTDLQVRSANRAYYRLFQTTPETTIGESLFKLANGQWDIPSLRELLEKILPENHSFDDFAVELDLAQAGRKKLRLNARRIPRGSTDGDAILLAIENITQA